ncbi:radical SAM protein [Methanococcoides burtonii]|uniref:Fe-S protein, radical SAM family n=1 Tax=Methanococcoides burtonii (strain DSM 6242 / NBRC 107633 / OCM 468 / ACE-M) TaxID=259564 RepID=Q12YJ5_METBU|nr:radical SAM protein [Methanococcoides burtonii]ABE51481.1 Fe-S protein, radical SAM family [Methanococcoides burtonii DSM 6242]
MKCNICEIGCDLVEGKHGQCRMYTNEKGVVVERFPNNYFTMLPISIETMPLLHFYPNSKFLQVCTIGCNFNCEGCISEILASEMDTLGRKKEITNDQVIKKAFDEDCIGIVFCLNDPIVSFFTFKDLAEKAKENDLLIGCSTNGYYTEAALKELIPLIDFVNLGIKGYSDERYLSCGANSSTPAFRNLKLLHESNVHVEVSTIYLKGFEDEVINTAKYVSSLSKDIPFQVMRFVPFGDAAPDLEPTIKDSEILCDILNTELDNVYLFNSPGTEYLNTTCKNCGKIVFQREFFGPMGAHTTRCLKDGFCECGISIRIKGTISKNEFQEPGFMGGYRPTRALEMVHAILTCLGVKDDQKLAEIWMNVMEADYLQELHHDVQKLDSYFDVIRHFATLTEKEAEGMELIDYMKTKLDFIRSEVKNLKRPRVYYSMGYPLFSINGERIENNLVEAAGGDSVNRCIEREGKPGVNISSREFIEMNPEFIFISGLFSSPVSDSYEYCRKNALLVDAVKNENIYGLRPSWDFGSPRWILGLMYIANKIHSDIFNFDIDKEANVFYEKFYGVPFTPSSQNRSFYNISLK